MIDPDVLRLRILLHFYKADDEKPTVTECAKNFQTGKYTVSRIIKGLSEQGLIDNTNPRRIRLTQAGRTEAEKYHELVENNTVRLLQNGVDYESAQHDAYVMALYFSDATLTAIKENRRVALVKYSLMDHRDISGEVFFKKINDGTYRFPFFIAKNHTQGDGMLSMANRGFEHPCTVKVSGGVATVYLKAKTMTALSAFSGSPISGKVSRVKYYYDERFTLCEQTADVIAFPANCLTFENVGGAQDQLLYGSVIMKFQCSAGEIHMPESIGVFSMLI